MIPSISRSYLSASLSSGYVATSFALHTKDLL
uniref:Uncharacterized protein n=1 Tax=Utricularia reniformis TaxID=192314 RepID=A0A1Y0B3B3_9LAMI|nr:hypothetical protein AEK19_MT1655 [Utricularia reniformis]ART31839.1 hypothetical protein AEK19_MT1655 [Utricularia reniformis]